MLWRMTLTTGDTLRRQGVVGAWDDGHPLERAAIWLGAIVLVVVGLLVVAVLGVHALTT
jgi:hypothetical protein